MRITLIGQSVSIRSTDKNVLFSIEEIRELIQWTKEHEIELLARLQEAERRGHDGNSQPRREHL